MNEYGLCCYIIGCSGSPGCDKGIHNQWAVKKQAMRIHSRQGGIHVKEFRKIISATRSCARRDKRVNRTWSSRWESVGVSGTQWWGNKFYGFMSTNGKFSKWRYFPDKNISNVWKLMMIYSENLTDIFDIVHNLGHLVLETGYISLFVWEDLVIFNLWNLWRNGFETQNRTREHANKGFIISF
jgi:hypothetical protein